jgi:hypothetical protein
MGQCQPMLEKNEKNTKKKSIPPRFEDMGAIFEAHVCKILSRSE